jgi:hypothetical protein
MVYSLQVLWLLNLSEAYFNIILPFARRSAKWSLHCKFCGYLVYLRSTLILSYPLLEGLSNGLFPSCIETKELI